MVLLYVFFNENYSHRILERHIRDTKANDSVGATASNPWAFMAWSVFVSECLNFIIWFVKFAPLFLLLFPIHRAQWHHGGSLSDYLCFRRPCAYWVAARIRNQTATTWIVCESRRQPASLHPGSRSPYAAAAAAACARRAA